MVMVGPARKYYRHRMRVKAGLDPSLSRRAFRGIGASGDAVSKTGGISGVAIGVAFVGIVFAYSAVKGDSITHTIAFLMSGKQPQPPAPAAPTSLPNRPYPDGALPQPHSSTNTSVGIEYPPAYNKAIGKLLAATFGWASGPQWDALDKLWTRESGWRNTAKNPTSGAFGIPQALPESKLPKLAQSRRNGGICDPQTQILWGLNYIKSRPDYGSPVAAWAHEQSMGWY